MIIEKPRVLHTTVDHGKTGIPSELRRQHEVVMAELAKQAGMAWDGGTPPPAPPAPNSK